MTATRPFIALIVFLALLSCTPPALIRLGNSTVTVELDVASDGENPSWTLSRGEIDELSSLLENPVDEGGVSALPEAENPDYGGFQITASRRRAEEPPRVYLVRDGYIQVLRATGEAGRIFRDVRGAEDWLIENARDKGYGAMIP